MHKSEGDRCDRRHFRQSRGAERLQEFSSPAASRFLQSLAGTNIAIELNADSQRLSRQSEDTTKEQETKRERTKEERTEKKNLEKKV
jgi:hypothetical protein